MEGLSGDELLAWAAGLFEGEGCFTIRRKQPVAKLNSTDLDVVKRFHDVIGVGRLWEDTSYVEEGRKVQWAWIASNKLEAGVAICRLAPFMHKRRAKRAAEVLEVC